MESRGAYSRSGSRGISSGMRAADASGSGSDLNVTKTNSPQRQSSSLTAVESPHTHLVEPSQSCEEGYDRPLERALGSYDVSQIAGQKRPASFDPADLGLDLDPDSSDSDGPDIDRADIESPDLKNSDEERRVPESVEPGSSDEAPAAKQAKPSYEEQFNAILPELRSYFIAIQSGNSERPPVPGVLKKYLENYYNSPVDVTFEEHSQSYEAWPFVIHPALPGVRFRVCDNFCDEMRNLAVTLHLLLLMIAHEEYPEGDENYRLGIRNIRFGIQDCMMSNNSYEDDVESRLSALSRYCDEGNLSKVITLTATREMLDAVDPEKLKVFASQLARTLRFDEIEKIATVPYTKPCSSRHEAFVKEVSIDLNVELTGFALKMKRCYQDCSSKEDGLMIVWTLRNYLDHLASGNIGAAYAVLRDFRETPLGQEFEDEDEDTNAQP